MTPQNAIRVYEYPTPEMRQRYNLTKDQGDSSMEKYKKADVQRLKILKSMLNDKKFVNLAKKCSARNKDAQEIEINKKKLSFGKKEVVFFDRYFSHDQYKQKKMLVKKLEIETSKIESPDDTP